MVDSTLINGDWTIDPVHSRVGFSARHAMVTKVRGHFAEFSGEAHLDADTPANSHVNVVIQAASIDTGNDMRDDHVRGEDFLAVEQFPTITFRSTHVEQIDDETARITGNLTVKETTKSVTIDFDFHGVAEDHTGTARAGFEGETSINRQDYGVTFAAPLEAGGVLVSDKVGIDIEVSLTKN